MFIADLRDTVMSILATIIYSAVRNLLNSGCAIFFFVDAEKISSINCSVSFLGSEKYYLFKEKDFLSLLMLLEFN